MLWMGKKKQMGGFQAPDLVSEALVATQVPILKTWSNSFSLVIFPHMPSRNISLPPFIFVLASLGKCFSYFQLEIKWSFKMQLKGPSSQRSPWILSEVNNVPVMPLCLVCILRIALLIVYHSYYLTLNLKTLSSLEGGWSTCFHISSAWITESRQ